MTADTDISDDDVARAIIRRRARFYVLPSSPFENWALTFTDRIDTYYIDQDGYGFHTGDHWQDHHDYFRPAPHLMETILKLVHEAAERQRNSEHVDKSRSLISGTRP